MNSPAKAIHRLDAICPYFTRFPLSFPLEGLRDARAGESLLDPFCGCGSALFAARLKGMFCAGVECNPVAVAITRAKIPDVSPEAVIAHAEKLLATGELGATVPDGSFWEGCFAPNTLDAVCRFRTHFSKTITTTTDKVLCGLLLGLLHGPSDRGRYLSNIMPASYAPDRDSLIAYWTANNLFPPEVNVMEVIEKQAKDLLSAKMEAARGQVVLGDSRMPETYSTLPAFDWVITSPPYFGLNSFMDDQWLRHWFLGNPVAPDGLLDQTDTGSYVQDLARVWRHCSTVCRPGAWLLVRFGGVPGFEEETPQDLLSNSFGIADAGWRIERIKRVTVKPHRAPQPLPFSLPAARPVNEFELYARLEK